MSLSVSKRLITTSLLAVISLISFLPFYMMISMGTHANLDLFQKIILLPGDYFFENFKTVMSSRFDLLYMNSLIVSIASTFLSVLVSALTGFAFAKYQFKFKSQLFGFILLTMMLPSQIGLVAYVIEMRMLGFTGTLLPLIVPFIANSFGVFWMTQYMKNSVPTEVIESGRVDGCSDLGIFLRIVLPFIGPAITTLSLLVFLWSWNNYVIPLVTINDPKMYTIPLGIANLGNEHVSDLAARILGITLGTFPVLILFIIGSKSFIRGLTEGAVKG